MKGSIILILFVAVTYSLRAQSEFAKLENERKQKQELPRDTAGKKVRYSVIGTIDFMYGFFKWNHYGLLELSVINGIRIKNSRVGIGLSLAGNFYNKPYDFTRHPYSDKAWAMTQSPGMGSVNLFVNYHQEFCRTKVRPSIGVSAGYPFFLSKMVMGQGWDYSIPSYSESVRRNKGLFYMGVEAGITFRISKKAYMNHSLFYKRTDFHLVYESSMKNTATGTYFYKHRVDQKTLLNLNMFGLSTKFIF